MPRSKELSEKLREKIIIAHKAGEGYKKIVQWSDVNVSTMRQVVYEWRYFKTTTMFPEVADHAKSQAEQVDR